VLRPKRQAVLTADQKMFHELKSNIGELRMSATKRKVEIFSAGCSTCKETIELVKRLAGSSHDVEVHDMNKSEVASRARNYGVRSVPAVVIDGKLASCCAGRGPEEHALRAALA